jgi:3-deoxy-7-phosphoheptulonate synthase
VLPVTDINISANRALPTPRALIAAVPKSPAQADFVARSREDIHRIIFGDDPRWLLVVGPCSIHDVTAGREYAERLAELSREVSDRLLLVMRVYFEKPRTTVGWKGLIMDPHLDGTGDIPAGLKLAREFLRTVVDLGVPTATELLDPITPQYIADLICWSAIGARTTESQTHRQMASGLSMPLGFKNGTDGSIQTAINAIKAARSPQTFLGINDDGQASAVSTRGNPNCHLVLRGGAGGPNYSAKHVAAAEELLRASGLPTPIMVDCSHDNSGKNHERQAVAFQDVLEQRLRGRGSLIGAMIESNLGPGSQAVPRAKGALRYGVSITDACMDWPATETLIRAAHAALPAVVAATA